MAKISSCHMWPLHLEKGVCRRRLLAAGILDRMFVVEGLVGFHFHNLASKINHPV